MFDWVWNGILVFVFMGLMFLVMWITDEGIALANKVWGEVFPPLNKPF